MPQKFKMSDGTEVEVTEVKSGESLLSGGPPQALDAETFKGYPFAVLTAIFDAVSDPDDWKGPISAITSGEGVKPTVAAIEYYTATTPSVELDTRTMRYVITSEGYRAGPAGDH